MTIRTEFIYPDVPIPSYWLAYDSDTYDGPGSMIAWGETEQEAIDNLMLKYGDRNEERGQESNG